MPINKSTSRREFIKSALATSITATALSSVSFCSSEQKKNLQKISGMHLGLVTYLWGRDWDLETLITNCEEADFKAVELRTQHAHGVEPSLDQKQRAAVKARFDDSPVVCVGYGSNQEFHSPDPDALEQQINGTYELIKLCFDIGATGVKVKPNNLPEGVPPEQTIEQIGTSLNKVGKFAQDYGQEIRVEVHGRQTQLPANMKSIFDHVTEPNVKICWNCNRQDLVEPGLAHNFDMLKKWFGSTVHIREMNSEEYPYQELFDLFVSNQYSGYILLEARTEPDDRVAAMKEQKEIFENMISNAKAKI